MDSDEQYADLLLNVAVHLLRAKAPEVPKFGQAAIHSWCPWPPRALRRRSGFQDGTTSLEQLWRMHYGHAHNFYQPYQGAIGTDFEPAVRTFPYPQWV